MKIAVLGATGMAGSRIVAEALRRGHQVTGVARHMQDAPPQAGLVTHEADIHSAGFGGALRGHDLIVSAVHFTSLQAERLIGVAKEAGIPRIAVVGGAGSLEVAPGVQLVDTPEFPAIYKAEALAGREFLNRLKSEGALEWTFLSPSAFFEPGERTGVFRLGGDALLADGEGQSRISAEDYAIALLDEIETPRNSGRRFTVGY